MLFVSSFQVMRTRPCKLGWIITELDPVSNRVDFDSALKQVRKSCIGNGLTYSLLQNQHLQLVVLMERK